jgi:hypothetical protein
MGLRRLLFVIAFLGFFPVAAHAEPAATAATAATAAPAPASTAGATPGTTAAAAAAADCTAAKDRLSEVKVAQVFRVSTMPPTVGELDAALKEPHPLVELSQHIGCLPGRATCCATPARHH